MVNTVSLIPLTPETHSRDQTGKLASAEPFSPQFFLGPENRLLGPLLAAVIQDRSDYSPVVLHGPTGVGKSHLAGGLAARYRQAHAQAKLVLLSGRDFARAYASAVELDSLAELRNKYQRADFFVLDGLESLGNKPSAQHELLYTLDALQQRGRWVLATSRSPVVKLHTLQAGLRSRLRSGLDVPLALPSPATRRAVVEDLARQNRLPVSHRLVGFVAGDDASGTLPWQTVPELRRAFLQCAAGELLEGRSLDDPSLAEALREGCPDKKPSLRDITKQVAKYFRLKPSELTGASRRQGIVRARGVAIYISRQMTGSSYEQLGRHFGGRDHTTVLHAFQRAAAQVEADVETRHAVGSLTERLLAAAHNGT